MKNADDYMSLPYHVEIVRDRDEDGNVGWVASVRELPGCKSQGATQVEAATNIQDAMRAWLEVAIEHGDRIPEPDPDGDFSGQTVIRMPTSLHALLAERAKREKTTLNQMMVSLLSRAVGLGTAQRSERKGARKASGKAASGKASRRTQRATSAPTQ